MKKIFLVTLVFTALFSCKKETPQPKYSALQIDSLTAVFEKHIQKVESDFKTADWSPLTPDDKTEFTHLNYYPYDVSWRFSGPLHINSDPDSFIIRGSREGDLRPALKYGYFEFEKDNQINRLQVIKILPTKPDRKPYLFLGFWDETSDQETYGGGRYIDIEEKEENFYTLDFNFAYNPYCAYSDRYSCAVPPFENRLKLAVTAGEKIFKEHE